MRFAANMATGFAGFVERAFLKLEKVAGCQNKELDRTVHASGVFVLFCSAGSSRIVRR